MVEPGPPRLDVIFHALGDATRRHMLSDLARGERSVGQLAAPFPISLAAAQTPPEKAMTADRPAAYGTLVEPATLQIRGLLPGPIEGVCACLTERELRRQCLASDAMPSQADAPVEFVGRNDERARPAGTHTSTSWWPWSATCRRLLYGKPERPAVCVSLRPTPAMCGEDRGQAMARLDWLERQTRPR